MHSSYTNHRQKKHGRKKFWTFRTAVFAALLVGLNACGSEPLAGNTTLAGLEIAAPAPNELIFSSVKGTQSQPQTITLENIGAQALELHALSLTGAGAAAFTLSALELPLAIPAGGNAEVAVTFAPQVSGSQSATLQIQSSDPDDSLVSIALYGLGSDGEQGVLEPPLHDIVQTLGYDVDVGGEALRLGTGSEPIGAEVLVPLFEQVGSSPVTLTVVARYGPEEVFPYGFFHATETGAAPSLQEVGQIAAENAQELVPPLAAGSATFNPGNEPFGIYGQAGGETQYSLDALNQGLVSHALRVYPLRDRSGNLVPNSYLIGLEEAKNGDYQDALFVLGNVRAVGAAPNPQTPAPGTQAVDGWEPLFNGQNLDGWYSYLPSKGRNSDPEGVFKAENGMIHILDVENRGYREFGYLATEKSYANYHLRLEYRWGSKRFAPRAQDKRDSGVVYHIAGGDRVWPQGVEYQIQEGDTGDFWLIDGTTLTTTVASARASEPRYEQFGTPYKSRRGRFVRIIKDGTYDSRRGWNTVDIIVRGDTATHMVNGVVNNRAYSLHRPDGSSLSSGKILLQAEGAEVFYRNIQIRPLDDE